jgi:hypothetical protein
MNAQSFSATMEALYAELALLERHEQLVAFVYEVKKLAHAHDTVRTRWTEEAESYLRLIQEAEGKKYRLMCTDLRRDHAEILKGK